MERPPFAQTLRDMTAVFDEFLASLSTLQSLSDIEVHLVDERALLHEALAALVENYEVERCSVFLCEGDRLVNAAGLDWHDWETSNLPRPDKQAKQGRFKIEKSLMGLAVQTGEPQICTDCRMDHRFRTLSGDFTDPPVGCVISAPIKEGGHVIGVINMSHPEPGHFNKWHQRLLPLYSNFLGQILTANRLLKGLEDEVKVRTCQLESVLEETRLLKQHYKTLSLVDDLTGLYNRRFFFSEIRLALGRAVRYRHSLTLIILDLDRFKKVNDTYGHTKGDTVLRDVAKALLTQLRETDILARVGGEEFAIGLPETDRKDALDAAERLLKAVRELRWEEDGDILHISASLGLATLSADQNLTPLANLDIQGLLDSLFSEADRAMYIAKGKGGNQIADVSMAQ
jgi:diguanylate cyclase (GGDEF)-like protein